MKKIFRNKKEIVDFWSSYSKNPNLCKKIQNYYTTKLTCNMIINTTNLKKEALILDVGCGWGRIAYEFISRGYNNLIGIDLTFDLLKSFKQMISSIPLVNAEAMNLPFKPNRFDLVYAVRVLQYIEEIEPVLKEFARVLKLGGKCVIIQPNPRNPIRKIAYHTKLIPVRNIKYMLENAGFKNIRINYYGFSFPNLYIPFFEYIAKIPFLKMMGAFYLIKGDLLSK